MNILTKMRNIAEQVRETEALRKIFGNNPFPKERIPYISVSNHSSDPTNNPNETGLKGFFTQRVLDLLFVNVGSGFLKLSSIFGSGSTRTILGTALKAEVATNGSGWIGTPVVTASLVGDDLTNGAVAPTYSAVITNSMITSLTQLTAGSGMVNRPTISITGTGTGATGYIIMTNNYLDERLINTGTGIIGKLVSDLQNRYYQKTEVDALLLNPASTVRFLEDFNTSLYSVYTTYPITLRGSALTNGAAGNGWSLLSSQGSAATIAAAFDFASSPLGNAAPTPPANALGVGVFSFQSRVGTLLQLANLSQSYPGSAVRTVKFRMKFANPNYTGVNNFAQTQIAAGVETYANTNSERCVFNYDPASNQVSIVAGLSSTIISTPGFNRNNYYLFEIRISATGTLAQYYLDGVLVGSFAVNFASFVFYPSITVNNISGPSNNVFQGGVQVDYCSDQINLLSTRLI